MNFNVDTIIPEDNKVRLVCNIVERMDLDSLLSTYSHGGRKAPDHSTVSRFQNLIIDYMNDLLVQFVGILLEDGHVDLKSLVYGSGRRKTQEQKEYEYYQEVNERFEVYQKHLEIMGERNSYSKTDPDAIFMRMKDDHMEGAFSKIKDGLGYDRYRHKSMRKIVADTILVAMGINLNKLHIKILKGQIGIIEYKKVA